MKAEHLIQSLHALSMASANSLADNIAAAERLRNETPLARAVGENDLLPRALETIRLSTLASTRKAMLRNFRALVPALLRQELTTLLKGLTTHLSQEVAEKDLRAIVEAERNNIRAAEAELWRRYVRGGAKALAAVTTPAD